MVLFYHWRPPLFTIKETAVSSVALGALNLINLLFLFSFSRCCCCFSESWRASAFEQLPGRLQVTRGRLGASVWQELCNSANPRSVGERLVVTIQQHEQKDCNSDRQQQQNVGQVDAETHHVWSGSRRTWKEETGTSRTSRIWKTQKGIGQFFTNFFFI